MDGAWQKVHANNPHLHLSMTNGQKTNGVEQVFLVSLVALLAVSFMSKYKDRWPSRAMPMVILKHYGSLKQNHEQQKYTDHGIPIPALQFASGIAFNTSLRHVAQVSRSHRYLL